MFWFCTLVALTVTAEPNKTKALKKLDLMPSYRPKASNDSNVFEARETEVTISGEKYRKIEFRGETFYIKYKDKQRDVLGTDIVCGSPANATLEIVESPEVRIAKHPPIYLQSLKNACSPAGARVAVDLDSKSKKKRKAYVEPPNQQGGFYKEF